MSGRVRNRKKSSEKEEEDTQEEDIDIISVPAPRDQTPRKVQQRPTVNHRLLDGTDSHDDSSDEREFMEEEDNETIEMSRLRLDDESEVSAQVSSFDTRLSQLKKQWKLVDMFGEDKFDDEVAGMIRSRMGENDRYQMMKDFKVSIKGLKVEAMIEKFLSERVEGFPLLEYSLLSKAEQEMDAKRHAQVRAEVSSSGDDGCADEDNEESDKEDNIYDYSREELEGMKRDDLRKLYKSKDVSSKGKKKDYINRFMAAQAAGFPSKQPKQPPKSAKERKDKYLANETSEKRRERLQKAARHIAQARANETSEKSRERLQKAARHIAQARANETEEETRARQENDAQRHAQVRADQKAKSLKIAALNNVSDVPGNDYDFESFTEDPLSACRLYGINNGGWAELDSKRLIAFIHVMNRLLDRKDTFAIHKLNGLLELSVKRYETFSKTTEQVFNMDDTKAALDYQLQIRESRVVDFEEAVLEWYATNDIISLEDRKARLPVEWVFDNHKEKRPLAWLKSLVGLRLSTSHGIFILDRVDYSAEDGKYYICKYDDEDDNKDYPMTYYDVVDYADHEQPGFSQFHLPKEPLCVHVDGEFRARFEATLRELRDVDSSMSADCYLEKAKILCNHAIREVGVYIDTQLITPERQQELMLKYCRSQGIGVSWGADEKDRDPAQLLTCACCGIRGMNNESNTRSYCKVDLGDDKVQAVLKLPDAVNEEGSDGESSANFVVTRQDHIEAIEKEPITIPINNDGDTKVVETWRLYSKFPAMKSDELEQREYLPDYMFDKDDKPIYYHLHPEFVDEELVSGERKKRYTTTLCSDCKKSIDADNIPRRSIAAGVDFGDANRIGLEPLTDRERRIISKVRHYLLVIKVESNIDYNRTKEKGQSAVKGCGIYFDDDSPQVVS